MIIQVSRVRALREIKRYHRTFDDKLSYTDAQISAMLKPTMMYLYGIVIDSAIITDKVGDKINYFVPV